MLFFLVSRCNTKLDGTVIQLLQMVVCDNQIELQSVLLLMRMMLHEFMQSLLVLVNKFVAAVV